MCDTAPHNDAVYDRWCGGAGEMEDGPGKPLGCGCKAERCSAGTHGVSAGRFRPRRSGGDDDARGERGGTGRAWALPRCAAATGGRCGGGMCALAAVFLSIAADTLTASPATPGPPRGGALFCVGMGAGQARGEVVAAAARAAALVRASFRVWILPQVIVPGAF